MNAEILAAARCFIFPRELAEHCYGALRLRGEEGSELFIALSGRADADNREILLQRAIVPEQVCHHTSHGLLVTIEGDALFELNRSCFESDEILAGQIHAHPTQAYHSGADDDLALVQLPGGLSFVVPDFARGPLRLRRWSTYQLRADGSWRPKPRRVKVRLT